MTNDEIQKLWDEMKDELNEKDPYSDWPYKCIVMRYPWCLQVVSCHEGFEEHESFMQFVREKAIRKEDFDESSLPLPPDLLKVVKFFGGKDSFYPNIIEAVALGDTLEEAIANMRKMFCLFDCGYILMDDYFYREKILDENNGGWMLDEDGCWKFDDDDDDEDDDDELHWDVDDDDDDEDDDGGGDDDDDDVEFRWDVDDDDDDEDDDEK
ncbi:MAG: hypothetical protein GX927_00300 [Lentisphaerae bacterium]|nr:hypothetical protein [Lentisphaerota bacterium]